MQHHLGGVFLVKSVMVGIVAAGVGCGPQRVGKVHEAIDAYHAAATAADLDGYIGLMAPTGVFLGTDASERWDRVAFRAFCEPYFAEGRGWTYVPTERHIEIGPGGKVAWFDEVLTNDSYGTLRGSGVLTRQRDGWLIEQYNLTFLVPNDIAKEVVGTIRAFEANKPNDASE